MNESKLRYRFGVFEFDAAVLELRREGRLVRLPMQQARLVAFLVQHADQVVSRDELRRAVWCEDTFVDFDAGRNFCISQIRLVLHDNSEEPVYIRTIPKRGYQFIAPVERVGVSEPAGGSTDERRQRSFSIWASVLAGAMVTAAIAFGGYHGAAVTTAKQSPISSHPCSSLGSVIPKQKTIDAKGFFESVPDWVAESIAFRGD